MENPTFKMEGVIKSRDEMSDFEGPLTVLLYLLSKNKVEIQDIRISEILDQYLRYLDNIKSMDLDIASEFVQMASHLVYIKTKTLLSEEEEIPELEMLKMSMEELKNRDIYKQIKGIGDTLREMSLIGYGYIDKPQEYIAGKSQYRYSHHVSDLLIALNSVLEMDAAIDLQDGKEFIIPPRIVYSVSEKADEILEKLRISGDIGISSLFAQSRTRSEIVATIVAILELCKMGSIICSDGDRGDYVLSFVEAPAVAITAE